MGPSAKADVTGAASTVHSIARVSTSRDGSNARMAANVNVLFIAIHLLDVFVRLRSCLPYSGRLARHDLERHFPMTGWRVLSQLRDPLQHHVCRDLAEDVLKLIDRAERRREYACCENIVEAHDGDVVRNAQTRIAKHGYRANRHQVVRSKDRRRTFRTA